jgi:hypothetical protein
MTVAPTSANTPCWGTIADIDPKTVAKIGKLLLERVIAIYKEAGVPLPARQLWAVGDVPYECNMLLVSLEGLSEGLLNTENSVPNPCDTPVIAEFNITVVRCAPVPDSRGTPPSPEKYAEAAEITSTDAYLLMKAACSLDMFGALIPGFVGSMGVESSVSIESAQGGVQAITLTLRTVV